MLSVTVAFLSTLIYKRTFFDHNSHGGFLDHGAYFGKENIATVILTGVFL